MTLQLLAQVGVESASVAGPVSSTAEAVLFWVFAAIAVGAGIAMVAMRNIVHAALMLVLNFLCIAALYLGLQSSFLSIIQVIVYAGAIVVLFLFMIMLLGVDRDDLLGTASRLRAVGAVMVGVLLAGAVLAVVGADSLTAASACGAQAGEGSGVVCTGLDDTDSVRFVAGRLFTRWTFAFELAALLLVVATLGALVLGRRKDPEIEDSPLDDPSIQDAARRLDEEAATGDDEVESRPAGPEVAGVGAGDGRDGRAAADGDSVGAAHGDSISAAHGDSISAAHGDSISAAHGDREAT